MTRYNPTEIEPKWQKTWAENKTFYVSESSDKPKKYVIDMFPYPSGAAMHVGHMRNYTISDVIAQFMRQKGYNVMHAMGWDTFGLPAENYAIKTSVPPQQSTRENIANFKGQLTRLGMSYDWSREINTTDPEYYKWTQWIFTQLFNEGLAYQKESLQWWCPVDKTVLANEQVEAGKCWRCGNEVVKKSMKQWFFKITHYADALLDGIDDLDWPEKIKTMQRNWIGRSIGAEITFKLDGKDSVKVFTTRPDTLFGATFLVLAPEHKLVKSVTTDEKRSEVEAYIKESVKKSDIERMNESREKTGVFTGSYATNPVNDEQIPIWVADYVLTGYGTGAIMAVPAHDERDWEFAKKFDLPIVHVYDQEDVNSGGVYHGEGIMKNSGEYNGTQTSDAREKIVADLAQKGVASEKVNYRMRDWLISRQRYWGSPIPMVHCDKDGAVAVPDDQLPVVLPEVESYAPTGEGTSALAGVEDWVNTTCPKCGGPAKRETDTMDGYACSSWYYLRYTDPKNDEQAWDPAKANYWMPIDYYCGGDHAVSHLLYSRFWMHFFADRGLIEKTRREPVGKLVYNGYILAPDGRKMSKSLGNVINPDAIIEQGYGADSLRLFEMFIAPYDQNTSWNTNGVPGTFRFLQRFWTLNQEFLESQSDGGQQKAAREILNISHKTIKKVTSDLEGLSFNTAVAALMEAVNTLYKVKAEHGFADRDEWKFALTDITQLLAPFAPHIAEELWQQLGNEDSVHVSNWPEWDESYVVSDTAVIAVQVNGKVRAELTVAPDASEESVKNAALAHENIQQYVGGKEIKRAIYVPGRLINIVI
jgi:leucyl-tRNA synthetase